MPQRNQDRTDAKTMKKKHSTKEISHTIEAKMSRRLSPLLSETSNLKEKIISRKDDLFALETLLVDGESVLEELLFLLQVNGLKTGGHGGTRCATSVHDVATVVVLGRVQQCLDTGLDVAPRTGVQRFFLGPDDVASVGVAVEVLLELSPGEGVQLLNTGDGGVADVVGLTVLQEGSVDLTSAHDDALNLLGLVDSGAMSWVRDNPLEVRVISEFLQR
jgi:hypothetical protein